MPRNCLAILIYPWIFYLLLIVLFDIEFVEFNNIVVIPIIFAVFFSIIFFLVGHHISKKNKKFQSFLDEKPPNSKIDEPPYIGFLIVLTLVGCALSLYFDFIRTITNRTFISLSLEDASLLYNLRISKNNTSELFGSNLQLIAKALYPLSFFFYISNFTKKYVFYQWLIVILSLSSCLLTGGRFYFLYFFIIFIASSAAYRNVKMSSYFTFKNIILFLLFFYIFLVTFSLRAPTDFDVLFFYKSTFGIKTIALESFDLGILNKIKENFLCLVVYASHSFYFLSQHYETFNFEAYSYGGYSFNLIYRIINNILNLNLAVVQDYVYIDPTVGRYATFARDWYADFGIIGMLIIYSIYSFIFGITANLKNLYISYKIAYYWLVIFFLLAPMANILNAGNINLMLFYLIIYAFIERKIKK